MRGHARVEVVMMPRCKPSRKEGRWRVYGLKHPTDFEGRPFRPEGRATWKDGWFWIRRGDMVPQCVRVHGLEAARALCRQLNSRAIKQRRKHNQ